MKHTAQVAVKLEHLTMERELGSFQGSCNIFRWFVSNFARPAAFLHKKLRKDRPKTFCRQNGKERATVVPLKVAFISLPVVALPRTNGRCTIDTDGRNKEMGCVLFHEKADDRSCPAVYWSRTLNGREQKPAATYRWCLPEIWAVPIIPLFSKEPAS